ncbi:hypothetical protein BKA66DRAFT_516974 [Pyrenochaeta sp. MPI-SDFR-AT-0127]|nr:hypothetical protein BKA66DRAFT_516974 [Pyrenochaeta sp. MPI-SDFR-AT-0127]
MPIEYIYIALDLTTLSLFRKPPFNHHLSQNASEAVLCGPQDGLHVTADCIDPDYYTPIIDSQNYEPKPLPHYKIGGHFENTSIRFNFYFPPKNLSSGTKGDGRFFQFAYPTQDETATEDTIGFGLDSGAYIIQVTGTQGYRAEAASAKFSRKVAAQYYDLGNDTEIRIYGYIYGASGGSLQTIGALENTIGVWDGAVPIVQAIPVSVGTSHTLRPMAGLVLQNKSRENQEAMRPGGSGNPYASLTGAQEEILREVVQLGLPVGALEDFYYVVNRIPPAQLRASFVGVDPSYVQDFWTKEGYLGSEESAIGELFRSALVDVQAKVLKVDRNGQNVPVAVTLADVPTSSAFDLNWDTIGYLFNISSTTVTTSGVLSGRFNFTSNIARFDVPESQLNNVSLYDYIQPNVTLHISNREILALHSWYRYQVPSISDDRGYIGIDHLRAPNGSSKYPTRLLNTAKIFAKSSAGGANHSGLINAKVIVVQNLLDHDALPWWAHWYRLQIENSLGEGAKDNYRLWYNSHTAHEYGQPKNEALLVDYTGIYQQALRDLSAWVEHGISPASTTNYTLTSSNAIVTRGNITQRGGIQPVVCLKFLQGDASKVLAGEVLLFTATAEAPPGTGKIVSFECDLYGNGNFTKRTVAQPTVAITERFEVAYNDPGDYVVIVRVTSQREGNTETRFARVSNLGRIKISIR